MELDTNMGRFIEGFDEAVNGLESDFGLRLGQADNFYSSYTLDIEGELDILTLEIPEDGELVLTRVIPE